MGSARAQTEPLPVLLRLAEPADAALFARIRGQTSDLATTLLAYPTSALEPARAAQLATARALSESQHAQVVIWAERASGALTLVVFELRLGRVLVRVLPSAASERDLSAQEEAAALVVRSALKASLAGEPLGEPEPTLAAEPVMIREASPEPRTLAPVAAARGHASDDTQLRGLLALGVLGGADGMTKRGHYGLLARAALSWSRLELSVRTSFGLRAPVALSLPGLRAVELAQHRVAASLGYRSWVRQTAWLTLFAGGGLHVFTSRVRVEPTRLDAASEQRLLASLHAGATLTWLPRQLGRRLGLAVGAWLEAFPRPLRLGYDDRSGFTRVARAWPVQPVLSVELVLRLNP